MKCFVDRIPLKIRVRSNLTKFVNFIFCKLQSSRSEDCFYYCLERNNVVVWFGTLRVQSFILIEVSDCGLLIVVTSSTFLKRKDIGRIHWLLSSSLEPEGVSLNMWTSYCSRAQSCLACESSLSKAHFCTDEGSPWTKMSSCLISQELVVLLDQSSVTCIVDVQSFWWVCTYVYIYIYLRMCYMFLNLNIKI